MTLVLVISHKVDLLLAQLSNILLYVALPEWFYHAWWKAWPVQEWWSPYSLQMQHYNGLLRLATETRKQEYCLFRLVFFEGVGTPRSTRSCWNQRRCTAFKTTFMPPTGLSLASSQNIQLHQSLYNQKWSWTNGRHSQPYMFVTRVWTHRHTFELLLCYS